MEQEQERKRAYVDFGGLDIIDENLARIMKARDELNDAIRALTLNRVGFTVDFKLHKEEPASDN